MYIVILKLGLIIDMSILNTSFGIYDKCLLLNNTSLAVCKIKLAK